ncbi:MAG: hypothetical protein AAF449_20880, partial [Myxococcota bacterium]
GPLGLSAARSNRSRPVVRSMLFGDDLAVVPSDGEAEVELAVGPPCARAKGAQAVRAATATIRLIYFLRIGTADSRT